MAYSTPGKTREQVYRYMRKRIIDGDPPTVREVQEKFGFKAVQSARAHLENLVKEGRLVKHEGKARGYDLPRSRGKRRPHTDWVPLIHRGSKKPLDEAMESPEGYIPVQARRGRRMFAVTMRGDAMKEAGIFGNDVVIAQSGKTKAGDIVVARVKNDTVVRRMRGRGRRAQLQAEGGRARAVSASDENVEVLGAVVEVRRRFGGK